MILNKIKQNLAGFAVVALAFAGFSAMAPASATVYASNAGSIADPAATATWTQSTATNASTMVTAFTVPTGQKLNRFGSTTTFSSADSIALRGKVITYTYSLMNTGTNTAIVGGGTNPGVRVNNVWTSFPFPPSTPQVTWSSSTGSNDSVNISVNYEGQSALAAGTYEFTLKWYADGVQITTAPGNATIGLQFASGISGTTPALSTFGSVSSGYVCVNPALVAAGDVLTARSLINGAVVAPMSSFWYAGGNGVNSTTSITVSSGNISAGILAFKSTFGSSSNVTANTAYTADVSITNGGGTEVTYPCPVPSAPTVTITSSTSSSIVATVSAGTSMCRANRQIGQMWQMAGTGILSGTTCTISAIGPSFSDGTYEVVAFADGYWGGPVYSTNNPRVTYTSGSASSSQSSSSQSSSSSSSSSSSAPTLPTNVPLLAPIAMPATGFTPGGALTLSGSNLANLTSVKIGDAVAKTVASATGVTISVPSDLTPGAHNLLITTSTGSTLFVGAIKVADPAVEAAKAAQAKAAASIAYRAPVDFTVSKSAVAQAAAAKAFAAQYRNAKTAVCVAIPASKATSAAALAAAAKVCDGFKASVPGIKTSVVLGSPSGDKINRVSAEIQG